MDNYNNEKIRIPNETYCPSKKTQFNFLSNNLSTNYQNNNNSNAHSNIVNTYYNSNNSSSSNISNINTNINSSLNINFLSQDNSSEEGVTISPIKSIITSASSKPPTIIEPLCKLEKFLPPKTSRFHKTLVLDLDETLIHSYFDCSGPRTPDLSYDIFIEKKKIHVNSMVRPGAGEFLENVSSIFEIVVFTASLSEYANPLLDFVDKNKKCKYRLYREHCCSFSNGFANSFTKDLKKLDRDMKNLIIIDNNPKSYMLNKENGIPIKTWVEDINDRELYKLIPYLLFLGSEKVKDVRPFLKQVNSGNSLNYEKFDQIIMKYNEDNEKNNKSDKTTINLIDSNDNNKSSLNNKENKNMNINLEINNLKESNVKKTNKDVKLLNNNYIIKDNKNNNEDIINNNIQNKTQKENNSNNNNRELAKEDALEQAHIKECEQIKDKLAKITLDFKVKTGAADKVFGTVSTKAISEELKNKGFNIDKKTILLDSPIASLGTHNVNIELHKKVIGVVKVRLVKE